MKTLQQIIWFPWTLWCGLVFALICIMAFPILVFVVVSKNEKWLYQIHFLPGKLTRILFMLWGIRLEIHGTEFIEPNAQLIYISNHTSYLDGLVACAVIPNFLKFLGKGEILNWPVLGYLMKHLYVPVWREDSKHRAWSMEEMNAKLKTGASFYICPEGTCNTTPELLTHFHSGAHRLAIDNHLSIVPLTFINARYLFPRKGLMIKPGKVTVYWHKAISTTGLTHADTENLKQQTMDILRADLLKHYPGHYLY